MQAQHVQVNTPPFGWGNLVVCEGIEQNCNCSLMELDNAVLYSRSGFLSRRTISARKSGSAPAIWTPSLVPHPPPGRAFHHRGHAPCSASPWSSRPPPRLKSFAHGPPITS